MDTPSKISGPGVKQGKEQGKGKKQELPFYLREYTWQKGQSGNPKGRPPGKTMKEFARDFLANMSEESRLEFMNKLQPDVVWKMAEGMPHMTTDITTAGKPIPLLAHLHDTNNSDKEAVEAKEKD